MEDSNDNIRLFPDNSPWGQYWCNDSNFTERHKASTLHFWQQKCQRHKCSLQMSPNKQIHQSNITKGPPGTNLYFELRGGSEYPRITLYLRLTAVNEDNSITLAANFPFWHEEGNDANRVPPPSVTPGVALPLPHPGTPSTYSISLQQVQYVYQALDSTTSNATGFKDGRSHWKITFVSEARPICINFLADLNMKAKGKNGIMQNQFSDPQKQFAAAFKLINRATNNCTVILQGGDNINANIRYFSAIPRPTPPPYPRYDCRFNTANKRLLPVRTTRLPDLVSSDALDIRMQFAERITNAWTQANINNSIVLKPRSRIVPMMGTKATYFLSGREYEVIRQVGLIREAHFSMRNAPVYYNRRYTFDLVPSGLTNVSVNGANEFFIFLNVRPLVEIPDGGLHVPPPGTSVTIALRDRETQGAAKRADKAPVGAKDQSGRRQRHDLVFPNYGNDLMIARGVKSPTLSRVSAAGGGLVRSGSATSISSTKSITGSPALTMSQLAIGNEVSASGFARLPVLISNREERTWTGVVVPRTGTMHDHFDICIFLRIQETGFGLGLQECEGNFNFGSRNPPYSQTESAIRMAVHGDHFYKITPRNWLLPLLLAHENQSLSMRQTFGVDHPNIRRQNMNLNKEQVTALNRALSSGNHLNAKICIIVGPPGTGKTMTSTEIAYHSYRADEKLLMSAGSNAGVDAMATSVYASLKGAPRREWQDAAGVDGVYRLETEFDEHWSNFTERNGAAYSEAIEGKRETTMRPSDFPSPYKQTLTTFDVTGDEYEAISKWVAKRVTTDRPLSLGDWVKQRISKARAEGTRWTNDWGKNFNFLSQEEYALLWMFMTFRHAARRCNRQYADLVSAMDDDRHARVVEDAQAFEKTVASESTKAWRNLLSFYLGQAKIVLVTASTAGRRTMQEFHANRVLVDEAAQLTEAETLNAFVRELDSLSKLILVGDPGQLPPTVISKDHNEAYEYACKSLMVRLMESGVDAVRLVVQGRMDPDISQIVSQIHYSSTLQDHPSVRDRTPARRFRTWMATKVPNLSNIKILEHAILFIHVPNAEVYRLKGAYSSFNPAYLDIVQGCFFSMKALRGFHNDEPKTRITFAILCNYAEEITFLKKWMFDIHHVSEEELSIITVDGSQGKQYDYVILSTCRPGGKWGLGFVADANRQDVALSRAKNGLVIIGNSEMGIPPKGYHGGGGRGGWKCWDDVVKYCAGLRAVVRMTGNPQNFWNAMNLDQSKYELTA